MKARTTVADEDGVLGVRTRRMRSLRASPALRAALVASAMVLVGCRESGSTTGEPQKAATAEPAKPPLPSCKNPLDMDLAGLDAAHAAHRQAFAAAGIPADLAFERKTAPVGISIRDLRAAAKKCSLRRTSQSAPVLYGITNIAPVPSCFFKTRQVGSSGITTGTVWYFGWLSGANNDLADLYQGRCGSEDEPDVLVDKKTGDVLAIQRQQVLIADYAQESYGKAVEKLKSTCPNPLVEFSGHVATRSRELGAESQGVVCDDGDVRTVVARTAQDGDHANMFVVTHFSLRALRSYLEVATEAAAAKDAAAKAAAEKGL